MSNCTSNFWHQNTIDKNINKAKVANDVKDVTETTTEILLQLRTNSFLNKSMAVVQFGSSDSDKYIY